MAEHTASAGLASEKEARDVAEAARESEWSGPSFVRELFLGRFRLDLIHPHPGRRGSRRSRRAPTPFIDKLRAFLERVDSDMIDRTGEIPEEYVQELRDMGAFGIKIPTEYGGLGLSYTSYMRAMAMVTSQGRLAHRAAVGAPVDRFAAAAQAVRHATSRRRNTSRASPRARSRAFALTEVDAGSDPANMRTHARRRARTASTWITQRREAVVHQRHARRAVRRDGADAGRRRERQAAQADHGVHRRGELARRRSRASLPLHGTQGDRERRHPLHERARAAREHSLGRGEGTQARARSR